MLYNMTVNREGRAYVVRNAYGHTVYQSHSIKDCNAFMRANRDFPAQTLIVSARGKQIN